MRELFTINKYFIKYKWHFLLGILFVLLTNYFRILTPQITGYLVNEVVHNTSVPSNSLKQSVVNHNEYDFLVNWIVNHFEILSFASKVLFCGITLLFFAIISGLFMFLMRQTLIVMSRHIEFDQKNEIYHQYQKLDLSFYKSNSTGDLMNRITEDVSRVRMYTGPAIMYFINLAAVISFSIYFMLKSDVRLTLYVLSPLPVLAFTIYWVNTIINKKSERIQEMLSKLTSNAQESYSGIRVIKSFVQEHAMLSYFRKNSEEYKRNALSLAKTEAIYFPSMGLLIGLSTLLTVMIGGLNVVNHVPGSSVGKIAEFVLYVQMLTFPVSAIGWTASMIQRASASQKRINEFLLIDSEIKDEPNAYNGSVDGDIEFVNTSYSYTNTGIKAMKSFSLKIPKGHKIEIVGKTGSGKSTVAQLLLRMYNYKSGEILVNGVPLKNISLHTIRSGISYVPQDVFLFSDSIKNNIAFGSDGATDAQIFEAAKKACIHDEVLSFPKGFDTIVGERGITLSGGQKQRISLARALLKNPGILILDDCLSAVDAKTEKMIISNLSEYLMGKTAIIITHRIFPLLNFNNIIVMEAGQIAESGTHEELLTKQGKYSELFKRQQGQSATNS